MSAADVIEQILDAEDQVGQTLVLLASDAEARPIGETELLRGAAEIRRYAAENSPPPSMRAFQLYDVGDRALVYTVMAVPRYGEGTRYTELLRVGWVVTTRAGEIVSMCSYPDWDAARRAAGLSPDDAERLRPRREHQSPMFMRLWKRATGTRQPASRWAKGPFRPCDTA